MLSYRSKLAALMLGVGMVVAAGIPRAASAGDTPRRCFDVTIKCKSGFKLSGVLCCQGTQARLFNENGQVIGQGSCEITSKRRTERFTIQLSVQNNGGGDGLSLPADTFEFSGRIYFHGKLLLGNGTRTTISQDFPDDCIIKGRKTDAPPT